MNKFFTFPKEVDSLTVSIASLRSLRFPPEKEISPFYHVVVATDSGDQEALFQNGKDVEDCRKKFEEFMARNYSGSMIRVVTANDSTVYVKREAVAFLYTVDDESKNVRIHFRGANPRSAVTVACKTEGWAAEFISLFSSP